MWATTAIELRGVDCERRMRCISNVDPLTVIWKADFERRRTERNHRTDVFQSVGDGFVVQLRSLKPKMERKRGRVTKHATEQTAVAFIADCEDDARS
jgi:hypothetical protein